MQTVLRLSKKPYRVRALLMTLFVPLASYALDATEKNVISMQSNTWQARINPTFQSQEEAQQIINFLTGELLLREGTQSFQTGQGKTPLSFASSNIDYWGDYVCGAADCKVNNIVRENPFSVIGEADKAESTKLQIERTLATQGANIYDSAMWQIALAVGSKAGLIEADQARTLIDNQTRRLRKTTAKAVAPSSEHSADGFTYGENRVHITNPQYAYGLRFLAPSFFLTDPFKDSQYSDLVTSPESMIKIGKDKHITLTDWKPITGENAWAHLLGPLQATYLLHGSDAGKVPFDDLALQNALDFLRPLQQMQSSLGAFFYAANGADANDGGTIEKGTISIENNVSVLAGLQLLKSLIEGMQLADRDLTRPQKATLKSAVNAINIMQYGGATPQGTSKGLVAFFKEYAFNTRISAFYQGGTVNKETYTSNQSLADQNHYAADVNTWGVTVLGPETLDTWFGSGTAYRIWLTVKERSGFFAKDGKIRGIGYSDNRTEQVVSGEWTFGALTMLRILANYYSDNPTSEVDIKELRQSEASMTEHVLKLRTDHYRSSWSTFKDALEPKYQSTLPNDEKAFLYASKRTYIPFGWYGNPIPSSASTAWALTWTYAFNPFCLGGLMSCVSYAGSSPPYNRANYQIAYDRDTVTIVNTLEDGLMAVSYNTNREQSLPLISQDKPIGNAAYARIKIPGDATILAMTFKNPTEPDQWRTACQLKLTEDVKRQLRQHPARTFIKAVVTDNGSSACPVLSALNGL